MLEDNQWYGTMLPRIPAKHLNEIRQVRLSKIETFPSCYVVIVLN